jgi:predicted transglutaminase-like cysteine proteinase
MRKFTLRQAAAAGAFLVASAVLVWQGPSQAAFFGYPKALKPELDRLALGTPSLAPMSHVVFCLKYRSDCEVNRMAFRANAVELTADKWEQLRTINTSVNRAIRPEPNLEGLAGEKWLVSPKAGDCNDYAVTKRHELLARGWPSRSLLLAEVVVASGEHHLVVVVRVKEGDFVLDNLNANVRPWSATRYRWVRVQSPRNPKFWNTVRTLSA